MNAEELERRRTVVGASEAALLLGLPSFGGRTVSDLWYEKKFGIVESKGNASTSLGQKLEPVVLDWAQDRIGLPVVDRQKWIVSGANAATLDGRVIDGGPIVEAKTSGVLWRVADEWGEDGSDDVPDSYLIQVQAQMMVSGAELAYLAALIGGRGFAMFAIKPQAALTDLIRSKSEEFIASLASDEPPAEPPQLDTLKRIRRQPNKILPRSDAFDEAFAHLEAAKVNCKAFDTTKDVAQRNLLALLGDAEAAETSGGIVTYYEQSRKESFVQASTFRVLRFKKN